MDAVGNATCYAYDALHRVTSITYPSGSYAASTARKDFIYDLTSASIGGTPTTIYNAKGRLARAYTQTGCPSTCQVKTDEYFSYSERGEVTDVWQSTPNSSGFYHLTASYWANGAVNTLAMAGLGLPTFTYGADGEGRPKAVTASSGTSPIPSGTPVSYNVAGQVTGLTFGSGDSDSFGYDANTGRMTQYQYSIGATPQTVTGGLGWNANGTLGSLQITDQLNSANSQSCTYGYDDLVRLASVSCAHSPTNIWGQTFGYDPFGNLSKFLVTDFPGTSFQPTYNTATNRIASLPGFTCPGSPANCYDANGNTIADSLHTYAWDAEGKMRTADSITLTYDALGRMVESGTTQIVYSPTGQKLALMTGQTVTKAFVPLPGGAQAVYVGTTLTYYRHPDWLGSARLTTTQSRTVYSNLNYAPFGETYPASSNNNRSFTGQNQDTIAHDTGGLYDFLYREYAQYGRWISPDPAGLNAASLSIPQSLNRYAYVWNSSTNLVDPLGLNAYWCEARYMICNSGEGGRGYGWTWSSVIGILWGGLAGGGGSGGGVEAGVGSSTGPSKGPGSGAPLSGETLGIPNGMKLPTGDLASILLPGGRTCQFGVCAPNGNSYAIPLPVPICVVQPELCLVGGIGLYVALRYGPQIVSTVKDIARTISNTSRSCILISKQVEPPYMKCWYECPRPWGVVEKWKYSSVAEGCREIESEENLRSYLDKKERILERDALLLQEPRTLSMHFGIANYYE